MGCYRESSGIYHDMELPVLLQANCIETYPLNVWHPRLNPDWQERAFATTTSTWTSWRE